MFREPSQRPTGKAAAPRHPGFIGSRPEPVFGGGISSSCFGGLKHGGPGVPTAETIFSESVGRPKRVRPSRGRGRWKGQGRGGKEGRLGLFARRRKNTAASDGRVLAPPPLLRGFRVPEAAAAGGAGQGRAAGAGAPGPRGPPFAAGASGCRRGGHAHALHGRGMQVVPPDSMAVGKGCLFLFVFDSEEPPGL